MGSLTILVQTSVVQTIIGTLSSRAPAHAHPACYKRLTPLPAFKRFNEGRNGSGEAHEHDAVSGSRNVTDGLCRNGPAGNKACHAARARRCEKPLPAHA